MRNQVESFKQSVSLKAGEKQDLNLNYGNF